MAVNIEIAEIETGLFINNEFVSSKSGKTFSVVDPATEKEICKVMEADCTDVDTAVAAAKEAFDLEGPWRKMNGTGRRDLMLKLASLIEAKSKELAAIESLDNGKPISADFTKYGSASDVYLSVQCLRYYAGWADKITGKTIDIEGDFHCMTMHEPIGVVGQIIPWNFPLLMMVWKLGPALAAGCTIVLKTSEKTPLSALYVCKLIKEAGFPPGVVNILSGFGPTAGAALVKHPDVAKIAFTGSTAVGKLIQREAAETLKKVTLELGGKSPLIIFDDADLDQALDAAHTGLFLNNGQCCCAGSRVFVHENIYDEFVAKASAKAKEMVVGNGKDPKTDKGPIVDKIQFDKVMKYIKSGKEQGAVCNTGGGRSGDSGYFIQPTIFSNVTDDMKIAREEIFGPVMSVLKFSSTKEVIVRANETVFGLAAGVCTRDVGKALYMAKALRAGTVWVNCYNKFDIACPFGGYKQSGSGRECGEYGLENYIEVKTVTIPIDPKLM